MKLYRGASAGTRKRAGAAVLVVVVTGLGIFARSRLSGEAARQRWLNEQPTDTLRSLDAGPDADTAIHVTLASRLLHEGKLDEAHTASDAAIKALPGQDRSQPALEALGLAAYFQAQYGTVDSAEAAIAAARMRGSNTAAFHLASGLLAERRHQPADALSQYALSAQRDPSLPEAWSRMAAIQATLATPSQAAASLRQLVRLEPDNPQPHADLAQALGQMREYGDAATECARAAALAPNDGSYATLPAVAQASSARSETDYRAAEDTLAAQIVRFPQVDFLHELLSGLHARFGRYASARTELETYLKRNPADWGAWLNLSIDCSRLGDNRAATGAFGRYRNLIDLHSAPVELTKWTLMHPQDAAGYELLSAAFRRDGKIQPAYDAMVRASEVKPDNASISRAVTALQAELNRTSGPETGSSPQ